MELILVTPAAVEPFSADEFIQWKKLPDGGAEDPTTLQTILRAARESIEEFANLSAVQQVWRYVYSAFPGAIRLPRGPVASVDSVKYYDSTGAQQTLSALQYTVFRNAGIIEPVYGSTWPSTQARSDAVEINYTAGYGISESVSNEDSPETFEQNIITLALPEKIKTAILLMASHLYDNRELLLIGQADVANLHVEVTNAIRTYLCNESTRFEF